MENTDLKIKKTDLGLYRQCFPNFSFEELVSVAMLLTARDVFKKHDGKECLAGLCETGKYMAKDIANSTFVQQLYEEGVEVIEDDGRRYEYAVSDVYRMYHKWCKELKVHELPIEEDVRPVIGKMDLRSVFCKKHRLMATYGVAAKDGWIMGVSGQMIVASEWDGQDMEHVSVVSPYSKIPFDTAKKAYIDLIFPPYTDASSILPEIEKKAKLMKAKGETPVVDVLGCRFNHDLISIGMKAVDKKSACISVWDMARVPAMKITDGKAIVFIVGMKKEVWNA